MRWHKVEFEFGDSKHDEFGQELGYSPKGYIKKVIRETLENVKRDYYFHIRKIKIKEAK